MKRKVQCVLRKTANKTLLPHNTKLEASKQNIHYIQTTATFAKIINVINALNWAHFDEQNNSETIKLQFSCDLSGTYTNYEQAVGLHVTYSAFTVLRTFIPTKHKCVYLKNRMQGTCAIF